MKKKLLSILLSFSLTLSSVRAQTVKWAGSEPLPSYVTLRNNIVNDHSGNVIMTGSSGLGSGSLAYIIKYDSNGTQLWGKTFSTPYDIGSISIDQGNNIYSVISVCENCNLIIEGQNYKGGAWVKYDPQGVLQLAYHPRHGMILGKKFTSDNTLIASGWFKDTITLKGNIFLQTSNSHGCYFIGKMDADGNFLWAIPDEGGTRIYQYTENDFFVTGTINFTSLTLGKGSKQVTLYSSNGMGYCAKYNNVGDLIWVKQIRSSLIAPDEYGNAYTFESDSNYPKTAFITKYDSAGALMWKRTKVYVDDWYKGQMHCGPNGELYLSGGFKNYMTIDSTTISGSADYKMFLAKLDSSGTLKWITTSSGSGGAGAKDISVSGNEIFITGDMGGQNTFGSYTLNEPNGGVFTLKITDDETESLSVNETKNISGLLVYPNPAGDRFNVIYSSSFLNATINIRNQLGQLILSRKFSSQSELNSTFDLSSQPKGVYLIEFISNEAIEVKKIIVE